MTRIGNALRLLTYGFAAVDQGSLRQAAKVLRVRESSVSRNIVKLEQLLDTQLFERDVRGVRLTEAGREWMGLARTHYEGLLSAFAESLRDKEDTRTVRIGLCRVTGGKFLERLVNRFADLHPDVNLTIQDLPAGQCLAAIRRRRLDVAFMYDLGIITSCCSEVLWEERLFVLLPSCHSLVEKTAVTWSDLAGMRLLVPIGLEGLPFDMPILERIVARGGPAIEICDANQTTVIFKVRLGQGVALAQESYAETIIIDSVMWKPLDGQNSISSVRAFWLGSNPKRSVLRLVGLAKNMAKSTPPERSRRADLSHERYTISNQ